MQPYKQQSSLYCNLSKEVPQTGVADSKPRLVVFPHAGSSAVQWLGILGNLLNSLEVIYVEYPGHGFRSRAPMAGSIAEIADEVAQQLSGIWQSAALDNNTHFFGYSMGGLVAYEVCHRLQAKGQTPEQLYISSYPAPGTQQYHLDFEGKTDAELMALLQRFDSQAEQLFASAQLAQHYVPVIKHDFLLLQHHQNQSPEPIECKVSIWAGKFDRAMSVQDVFAWRDLCSGETQLKAFAGDHFFIYDHAQSVADMILKDII